MATARKGEILMPAGQKPLISASDVPQRLSSIPGHPDHDPVWSPMVRGVWVDDKEIADVVRFDVQEGWVEFLERDDGGQLITFTVDGHARAATTTVRGVVRVNIALPRALLGRH